MRRSAPQAARRPTERGLVESAPNAAHLEVTFVLPTAQGSQLEEAETSVCRRFWEALRASYYLPVPVKMGC
jgi:hypothetical protein